MEILDKISRFFREECERNRIKSLNAESVAYANAIRAILDSDLKVFFTDKRNHTILISNVEPYDFSEEDSFSIPCAKPIVRVKTINGLQPAFVSSLSVKVGEFLTCVMAVL